MGDITPLISDRDRPRRPPRPGPRAAPPAAGTAPAARRAISFYAFISLLNDVFPHPYFNESDTTMSIYRHWKNMGGWSIKCYYAQHIYRYHRVLLVRYCPRRSWPGVWGFKSPLNPSGFPFCKYRGYGSKRAGIWKLIAVNLHFSDSNLQFFITNYHSISHFPHMIPKLYHMRAHL